MADERVRQMVTMAAEANAGVAPAEWSSLEYLLGFVEDDEIVTPADEGEREALLDCFVRLGWGTPK
jgi:hypothetical protein